MEIDLDSTPAINLDDGDHVPSDSDSDVEVSHINTRRSTKGNTSARKRPRKDLSQPTVEPNLKCVDSLGSIKSIELVNFMCHSNFYLDLGQRVNFIIGRNGSGKSAILTAIMLVLGAKSSSTARGSNVKRFIKTGEGRARITIVLNNWNGDPEQSYRYEDYGKEIIVERHISQISSSYSIKNSKHQVIATKSVELREILRFFAIQVENPVVILTQETSRNFLNSKNAKDKYSFFMKATNLSELRAALTGTKNELAQAIKTREEKQRVYVDMQLEATALEQQVQALNSLEKLRDRVKTLNLEYKWARVSVKEADMKKQEEVVESLEKELSGLEEQLAGLSAKVSLLNEQKDTLVQKSEETQSQSDKINADYTSINGEIENYKKQELTITADIRRNASKLKETDSVIKQFRETIEKGTNAGPNDLEERMKERKLLMIETRTDIEALTEEIRSKTSSLDELRSSAASQSTKLDEIRFKKSKISREIESLESRARDLKNVTASADFGASIWRHAPAVKTKLDRAAQDGRFRGRFPPVGPLGAYITLIDPKCTVAALSALKGLVFAYACDNNDDAKVLRCIINSTIPSNQRCPQIIVRSFRASKFDVEPNKVRDAKCKSLVDLIKVTDPNVFNVLIDKAALEKIAFIEDPNEATSRLLNQHTVPHNCQNAYDRDGTQYYPTTNNKVFRSYPYTGRGDNIFSKDVSGQILLTQEKIRQSKQEKSHMQDEEDRLAAVSRRTEREVKKVDEELVSAQDRLRELKVKYAELEAACESERPPQLAALQEELNEHIQQKESIERQLEKLNQDKRVIIEKLDELIEKRKELEHDRNRVGRQRATIADDIRKINDKIISARAACDTSKVDRVKAELRVAQVRLDNKMKEIDEDIDKIGGERIIVCNPPEQLKAEIEALSQQIANAEKKIGSKEELTRKNTEVQGRLNKITETCNSLDKCITSLQVSLTQRRKLLYKHREDVCSAMQVQFKRCLQNLNYNGSLEIDHGKSTEDGRLTISVNPKEASTGGDSSRGCYKDTRSLSGGERSYSTVAFLLALWEGCNSPFCILDEVDVFMDMIVRQIAMDTLVSAASETNRQYIFLSPLPLISDHIDKKNIKIHQLPEPVRGVSN